jgi:hypothetical protein
MERIHARDDASATHIRWDDRDVIFVRWTDQALVFVWRDTDETAVHLPRGVVARLVRKGVLHIDGERPPWAKPPNPPSRCTPIPAPPDPPAADPPTRPDRFRIISRLIRKLSGDGSDPAPTQQPAGE